MKIIIGGALGRMGRELAKAASDTGVETVCGVDVAFSGQPADFPVLTDYRRITQAADVLIDFSHPDGLPHLLVYAQSAHMPLVLCTTGYNDSEQKTIADAARQIPILRSANMSLGISVLQQLATMAAQALGDGFDVEIVEKHHRQKADSPSGTALMLYDSVCKAKGGEHPAVYGRYGRTAKRTDDEIGIHAVRGGTVTGEHEVGFYGRSEEIIITHRAESRALLAEGALRAAHFLMGKPAGEYTMRDVVAEMLNRS